MLEPTTGERRLAITVGAIILAAATDVAIRKAGGYGSDYARLLLALAFGVFTGAYLIGRAWLMSRVLAVAIAVTLGAGETYNLWQTAERVMNARELGRAPARAALKRHNDAEAGLKAAEAADVRSARLTQARADKIKADADYQKELREGGRCRTICNGLKADADKAEAEVIAALAEAESMKASAIETAKADLAANPLPASGTASSDETGIPVWVLDIISACLLSAGANGLAASLIAFGAHSVGKESLPTGTASVGQTDFDPVYAENVVRFFRPDSGGSGGTDRNPKPRPVPPGPTGLSKDQALADMLRRLSEGERIPSQDSLAADWGRPKQTVSDWMREWRRIGVVPAPVRTGRYKATIAG
ncbi:hypothetical protein [Hyphomicrobium sp. DY-1]|uniref:hypothetical protein n=1 Tax=Hyphomicrobium sp. DY-1 TaxID=3075650 RepID=UPI0039C3C41A